MTLLLLAACSEYDVNLKGDSPPGLSDPEDTGPVVDTTPDDSGDPDGTGGTDTVDDPCDSGAAPVEPAWVVGVPEADPTAGEPVCTDVGEVDWTLVEEWSYPLGGLYVMNPVVAPNAGRPGASVFLDLQHGYEVELDGRDGSLVQESEVGSWGDDGSTAFVGDADGDGYAEMVFPTGSHVHVWDTVDGAMLTAPRPTDRASDEVVTRADVDLDGDFEILPTNAVFDADGTLLLELGDWAQSTGTFVMDLDGDGLPELFNGAGIWDPKDGTGVLWDGLTNYRSFYAAPIDVGGDGKVLIASGRDEQVHLANLDGSMAWSTTAGGFGLASLADATGDGRPDLCTVDNFLSAPVLQLVDADGEVEQEWDILASVELGACSMADLDADGVYEVLVMGYGGFYILDGRTGDVLAHEPALSTLWRDSAPVIVDVDGDGSAEILVLSNDRLVALGPATGRWARTRRVWNQLAYDVTSIRDDGSLVSAPAPVWSTYGIFRAQPAHDGLHPDLAVEAAVGAGECDAVTTFTIDVRNQGSVSAAGGAVLRLLAGSAGGLAEVARTVLPDAIAPAEHVAATLTVDAAALGTWWVVEVLPAHADECDRTNDRAEGPA